jgi:UDP-N-acetylglucosamine acyltransferase
MTARVHPTAVVAARARIAEGVVVGAYAIVGDDVEIGARTVLHAHAVVEGPTVLGADNVVCSFAVVGGAPQLKKHGDVSRATLRMGDRNVVREHATLHRGAEGEGTRVGDDNLFMVGSHVAHDARVGSNVTLANATQLAGHAIVESHATFGGLSGVSQHVRVGESAFVAAGAMCERDVPPFVIVQGDRARVRGLNVVGLRRRGVPEESIARLERAFRALFHGSGTRVEALARLERDDPFVARLADALLRER